jgi:streptogramin lyase
VLAFDAAPNGMTLFGESLLLSLDQRIVRLDLATANIATVAGAANEADFVDGAGADARFSQTPAGLFLDGQAGLFVADEGNDAVRRVDLATGTVTTFAGASSGGSSDGAGSAARFRAPAGIAVDGTDIAYVADRNNHTLRRVVLSTAEVTTLAGAAGQAGSADGDTSTARFDQPSGIALEADAGLLYVADAGNHAIRLLDLGAGVVTTLPATAVRGEAFTGFERPVGLAREGKLLFVADSGSHTVLALDTKTSRVRVLAGVAGTPGTADGAGAQARFYAPGGLAVDGRGSLFVADIANDTIRKIVIATGEVTTVAGAGNLQGANDGIGRAARFAYPSGVAVGGGGELFVADTNNDTVRRIDLESGAVTTVIGVAKVAGVRIGPLPAQVTAPSAPVVTDDGRLLFFSENSLLVAR